MTRLLTSLLALLAASTAPAGEPQLFSSGERRASLIELFTSEGCSSCPPAENWLGQLESEPDLWREFVPVAFHVDYWDYLGWPDRFAHPDFSQRQRRYAREGGVSTVYTPGVFVDGMEWTAWRRLDRPTAAAAAPGSLAVEVRDSVASVAFTANDETGPLTAHLALLGLGLETRVRAGENRGRILSHDFVVLGIATVELQALGHRHAAELDLPATDVAAERYAIATWVTQPQRQRPLQATGGMLR